MTLRIEHVVGPVDNSAVLLREHVRARVEEHLAGGGQVCLIDFALSLGPFVQEWSGYDDPERFILFLPESFEDAESVIRVMCKWGVNLVVLYSPRLARFGELHDEEVLSSRWRTFLETLSGLETRTTVLAASKYRSLPFAGFEPWSEMAAVESILVE